jgi:hypothetical protein
MKWSKDCGGAFIYIDEKITPRSIPPLSYTCAPSSVGGLGRAYSRKEDEWYVDGMKCCMSLGY